MTVERTETTSVDKVVYAIRLISDNKILSPYRNFIWQPNVIYVAEPTEIQNNLKSGQSVGDGYFHVFETLINAHKYMKDLMMSKTWATKENTKIYRHIIPSGTEIGYGYIPNTVMLFIGSGLSCIVTKKLMLCED